MEKTTQTLQSINCIAAEDPKSFIAHAESDFERAVQTLAEKIRDTDGCKMIMLAGPSASGKTTTADMLTQTLSALGIKAHSISIDNFYKDQRESPSNHDGTPDYETVHALDLPLWSRCMDELLVKGKTQLPLFDFVTGRRSPQNLALDLGTNDLVIMEGIHALNPLINEAIPHDKSLRVYISVSSRVYSEDGGVVLSKRNLRLIRRLVRDFRFRASSVENTFRLWESVLKGEDNYLFPYKYNADVFIDSTHSYEPCVFRDLAIPLLQTVPGDCTFCGLAGELIMRLESFEPLPVQMVPKNSLLREFIGVG